MYMKAGLCGIAEPGLQPADELVTISTYMTDNGLLRSPEQSIKEGLVYDHAQMVSEAKRFLTAGIGKSMRAASVKQLVPDGTFVTGGSRSHLAGWNGSCGYARTYDEKPEFFSCNNSETQERAKTMVCTSRADHARMMKIIHGPSHWSAWRTKRDPLDSSDDEEGGADEEEPPKQKKSAPAKSVKPAKAKTTYVPDNGVAVQTGSEEEETPVRGDAEATPEDECILAFARNLWCFPSTAVVGKIGKPIVLSDELYATLGKKTKVPYGRVLSHEVLTMLTGVDSNGEQSRGLYVRYAPKSSPEKKIVLIALSKQVCEFHIGKIIERAEKAGVTEETFPCLSWKPHDLKNGGQIRPQESGWEKSNVPKELLDITTGKRSGPDDDDSASTAIVPTSVGAAKSHKAARIESGTQWIDIDSASDGLKIVKINIDNDMDEWTEVAAEEEEWVGAEKKEEEWTEVEMVTETGDGQRTT